MNDAFFVVFFLGLRALRGEHSRQIEANPLYSTNRGKTPMRISEIPDLNLRRTERHSALSFADVTAG
jgi:hypothetical protein